MSTVNHCLQASHQVSSLVDNNPELQRAFLHLLADTVPEETLKSIVVGKEVTVSDDLNQLLPSVALHTSALAAQLSAYRRLVRGMPIPDELNTAHKLQEPKQHDAVEVKSKKKPLVLPLPPQMSFDPIDVYNEREHRLTQRMRSSADNLASLKLSGTAPSLISSAAIKLKALRTISVQRKVRRDVVTAMLPFSASLTALSSSPVESTTYRRGRVLALRDAVETERMEQQQRELRVRSEVQRVRDFIQSIVEQSLYHREVQRRNATIMRSLMTTLLAWHKKREKDEIIEKQRREKERLSKLAEEDEEGYRRLLDEQKDSRLTFLMDQTNEYIEGMMSMVLKHKKESEESRIVAEKARVRSECLANGLPPPDEEDISATATSSTMENTVPDQEEALREVLETATAVESDEYRTGSKQTYYSMSHAITEKVTEQASTLVNGKLKEYQIKGLEWLVSLYNNNLNGILADEMGLGKTIQTIALITYVIEKKNEFGPFLVIVPLSTMSNWVLEFSKWAPSVNFIAYKGPPAARKALANDIKSARFNVLITTYEYIIKDRQALSKVAWKYVIIDEGHRLKNHACKLSQTIAQFYPAPHRLLLTGTPLQNNLPELWSLLNFLLPSIFNSVENFETWFSAPFQSGNSTDTALSNEETKLIIYRLHKVLRPFLLRRIKKEVESQLPDKTEYVLHVEMSALQRRLYGHMKKYGVLLAGSNTTDTAGQQSTLAERGMKQLRNILMHLRKLCNHPYLFTEVEQSLAAHLAPLGQSVNGDNLYRTAGKFELLDRMLPKLQNAGHRVLMFCQMTSLMTVMEDYAALRGFKYLRLDGGTKSDDRGDLLKAFNAPDSPYFLFLLSTRAGGLGLNLQTADTVIIFDSDWNPHQDLQAQDRAHRIGQTNEVRVLRLITAGTVEESILDAARFKLDVDGKVIQAGKFDNKSTASERQKILTAIINDEEAGEEENEVADDEAVNTMLARTEEEFELFEEMDCTRIAEERRLYGSRPRLMQEDELPEFMMMDNAQVEMVIEGENIMDTHGRGQRERNDVAYDDGMTEVQWLRKLKKEEEEAVKLAAAAADAKVAAGIIRIPRQVKGKKGKSKGKAKLKPKTKRKRAKGTIGSDNDENDEDDDDERDTLTLAQRISGKRKRSASVDVPSDYDDGNDARNSIEVERQINHLLKTLRHYHDSNNRLVCDVFRKLPTREELPIYYEVIKRPIDLDGIRKKAKAQKYKTVNALTKDVSLMISNAKLFNDDTSRIYEDARTLDKLYHKTLKELSESSSRSGGRRKKAKIESPVKLRIKVSSNSSKEKKKKRKSKKRDDSSNDSDDSSSDESSSDDELKKKKKHRHKSKRR